MKYILIFLFFVSFSFAAMDSKHKCIWDCPYKDITPSQWEESVRDRYDEGSDGYYIDMLHLEFPDKDYDELEDILFKIKFTS
jgi:hypothetical protein